MKGKNGKKSSRITSLDSNNDNYNLIDTNRILTEHTGKSKKGKKNWRFAYDLYCKEILTSNGNGNNQIRVSMNGESTNKSKHKDNKGAFVNLQ